MQYLVDRGYQVVSTAPNKYNSKMIVWMFVKTDALMQDIEKYFNELNKGEM